MESPTCLNKRDCARIGSHGLLDKLCIGVQAKDGDDRVILAELRPVRRWRSPDEADTIVTTSAMKILQADGIGSDLSGRLPCERLALLLPMLRKVEPIMEVGV